MTEKQKQQLLSRINAAWTQSLDRPVALEEVDKVTWRLTYRHGETGAVTTFDCGKAELRRELRQQERNQGISRRGKATDESQERVEQQSSAAPVDMVQEGKQDCYTVLAVGVDSLWLNACYAAEDATTELEQMAPDARPLDEMTMMHLTALQQRARVAEKPVATDYEFNGACLMMYPNGGGMKSLWAFILRNDALEVKVGRGTRNGIIAKVRLSAEYLWSERDLLYSIACVHTFLMGVFDARIALQVSELHLCADIVGYDFGAGDWRDGFVRRCGLKPHFGNGVPDDEENDAIEPSDDDEGVMQGPDSVHLRYRPITGLSFGTHKSAMAAVVYNKTTYIKQKAKDTVWFHDLWQEQGWDGETEVWRVEFRFKRSLLHECEIDSAYAVADRLAALWDYASISWLRYVEPSQDTNRSRWEVHPAWHVVQGAFAVAVTPEQIEMGPVVRERKRKVNIEMMIAQLMGCFITLRAWDKARELCECEDVSLVLHDFYERGEDYLARKQKDFSAAVRYKQRLYSLVGADAGDVVAAA